MKQRTTAAARVAALLSRTADQQARGYVALALGPFGVQDLVPRLLTDEEDLPWNAKIGVDLNDRASTVTLNDAEASTGVLNIL